jgi:O-antigen/teichoic acid export membrane protein
MLDGDLPSSEFQSGGGADPALDKKIGTHRETTLDTRPLKIKQYIRDALFRNSLFMLLASASSATFGFIFWMLAAKTYPKEEVGAATALISSLSLVILLSRFGLSQSLIRFFPEKDKGKVFGTSLIITTIFAILFGVIFIVGVDVWSPGLRGVGKAVPLLLIYLAANSITLLTGTAFIALRKAKYYFFQSLLMGSRIAFLAPLVFLGTLGILGSLGISFVITLTISLILLVKSGIKPTVMDWGFLSDAFRFSAGNYVAVLLMRSPGYILPVMVLNMLGAKEAAYYYVAFAITSLLFIIPHAVSTSLFVEGSHGKALNRTILKSIFAMFLLLVPAVVAVYFFGERVLELVGKDYAANGLNVLRIMTLSSFFFGICQIHFSIKRIQKDVKGFILLGALIFPLVLGLSYVFIPRLGLSGVGYAWMIGYGVSSLIVGVFVRSGRSSQRQS